MPFTTRSCGESLVMSSPSSRTDPPCTFNMPNTAFIAVDLPAPFGPTITAISPLLTDIVQPCKISGPLP